MALIGDNWEKWWASTGDEWFKKGDLTTTQSIAAAAFGAGHAAGESVCCHQHPDNGSDLAVVPKRHSGQADVSED